jgi:Pregnancy-associated plasma protein-A
LLVHEVGHWLGLPHVFEGYDPKTAPQGGCVAPGDGIKDTPAQTGTPFSCANVLDTCADLPGVDPGVDPLDNYMNYVPDACMNKFTAGQRKVMRASWFTYRAPGAPIAEPVAPPVPPPMAAPVPPPVAMVMMAAPVPPPVAMVMMAAPVPSPVAMVMMG